MREHESSEGVGSNIEVGVLREKFDLTNYSSGCVFHAFSTVLRREKRLAFYHSLTDSIGGGRWSKVGGGARLPKMQN